MIDMHGYQIRILIEKMYLMQKFICEKKWEELKKICKMKCNIEDIIFEIDDYPGEITSCKSIHDFFDSLVLGDFDGYKVLADTKFWFDNEQSDLSMECAFEFYGRELKSIMLKTVHVF